MTVRGVKVLDSQPKLRRVLCGILELHFKVPPGVGFIKDFDPLLGQKVVGSGKLSLEIRDRAFGFGLRPRVQTALLVLGTKKQRLRSVTRANRTRE